MTIERAVMFKALLAASILIWPIHELQAQSRSDHAALQTVRILPPGATRPVPREAIANAAATAGLIREWGRLRAGNGNFGDVQRFLKENSDWPGLKLLRRKGESTLPTQRQSQDVIAFFADQKPQSGAGAYALISALRHQGRGDEARSEAIRVWRTMVLSASDEARILRLYERDLKDHHNARMDMLLWGDAPVAAERQIKRVDSGWQALARARLALRAKKPNVDSLIKKIPAKFQNDPGLAFERMQWRARKGKTEDAVALMLDTPEELLGEPSKWAGWRRSFARTAMRAGKPKRAYKLASQHGLTSGSHFADLEWLSGYLALTYSNDPETAVEHFKKFRGAVETPISLGRAGYWEGRAYEAMDDAENARLAYTFGAEYQTSFYGLLAAERAKVAMKPFLTGRDTFPDWRTASFVESTVFSAARLFIASGDRNRAEQFLRHMTETLPAAEIGSLGTFLLEQNEPHLAVMVGKQAARRGIVLPHAYFPVTALGVIDMPVQEELALAIARRESEFDPVVKSGAGARGLMQLMPATAKAVAQYLQVPYSRERLTTEPAYNARLGTAYLDELMEIFDGNVVMVSAGYNAGPGRPIRWMKTRGDPRRGEIDIVDWIEHIPFNETRNYVMRVAESLPVYRARLTGTTEPINFTAELLAMPGHERKARKGEFKRPVPRPAPLID